MSFRRRAGNYLRPVNTLKHIIDKQLGLVLDVQQIFEIAEGVDAPVHSDTATDQVDIGSHVKSFFLNVQVAATTTASIANIYFYIFGNPGGNILTVPDGNVIGSSDFRKNVFHQEMIMTEKNTTAFPRTMFRGVIRVPRKFARIGSKDKLSIAFFSPGVNYDVCFQCIYKEIR